VTIDIDLDKLEALRSKAERAFGMELHEAYKNELFLAAPALFAELRRLRADLRTAVDLLDAVEQDQVQGELWCDARHAFLAALAAKGEK
jgi:hypothetical protein